MLPMLLDSKPLLKEASLASDFLMLAPSRTPMASHHWTSRLPPCPPWKIPGIHSLKCSHGRVSQLPLWSTCCCHYRWSLIEGSCQNGSFEAEARAGWWEHQQRPEQGLASCHRAGFPRLSCWKARPPCAPAVPQRSSQCHLVIGGSAPAHSGTCGTPDKTALRGVSPPPPLPVSARGPRMRPPPAGPQSCFLMLLCLCSCPWRCSAPLNQPPGRPPRSRLHLNPLAATLQHPPR